MKKAFFALILALVLTGSAGHTDVLIKRPKLPQVASRLPRIPSRTTESNAHQRSKDILDDPENFLAFVDRSIDNPPISNRDLERGWYFGQKYEKRYATPKNWAWLNRGDRSVWMRPDATLENPVAGQAALCESTAGQYLYSCYDFQTPSCKYIGISHCECPASTEWQEGQGCLAKDDLNDFVIISPDELRRGWYLGQKNTKKKNTPRSWAWFDRGADSRWQNNPETK